MPGIAANADKRVNQMLTKARREMSASLADVTGITTCTQKLVDNAQRRSKGTGSFTLNILPTLKEEK